MSRIYRYELAITDYQELALPVGSEVLSVAVSRTSPATRIDLWAKVTDRDELHTYPVLIFGTGNPMGYELGDGTQFVGTVVTPVVGLVWHVFVDN